VRLLRTLAVGAVLLFALAGATTSPNKSYTVPTPFGDTNTWGTMVQGDLNTIDLNLGGNCTITIVSPATTATVQQLGCLVQKLTGVLNQNTTYTMPVPGGGFWIVDNETTGGFTLTIISNVAGTSGFAPPQGAKTLIYADGAGNFFQVAPAGLAPTGAVGGDLSGNLPNPTVVSAHLTSPLPSDQGGVFAGEMMWDSVPTPPAGWHACDGSLISRTANPNLNTRYAAAGYPYGAGDGSTTLQLPDFRGRYIAGLDPSNSTGRLTASTSQGISAAAIANTGGEQAHTQTLAELVNHTHNNTLTDPGHSHSIPGGYIGNTPGAQASIGGASPTTTGSATASATTNITINNASVGGGGAFNEIPPTGIANCVVKIGALASPLDGTALAANDSVAAPRVARFHEAA
jgi:microcystin-dependent protein